MKLRTEQDKLDALHVIELWPGPCIERRCQTPGAACLRWFWSYMSWDKRKSSLREGMPLIQ